MAANGSDNNPGTAQSPFATLTKARDAVRAKIAGGLTGNIRIEFTAGEYPVAETVTFGPADSGSNDCSITYAARPGDQVVLTGGKRITGWKAGPAHVWTVELPEVKAGRWYPRQLWINGRRAIRARTPNADAEEAWWRIATSTATKDHPPAENSALIVKLNKPVTAYRNPGDVELVYMQNNECGWKRLGSIDEEAQTLTLAPPHRWNPKVFTNDWFLSMPFAGKPCYLENALEMLDEPGEWYLDRQTGVMSYWPRAGENLNNAEVIAPVLENTMLAVAGTSKQPVRNLHFDGLFIEHIDWAQPPWGYMAMFCCNLAVDGPHPGHRPLAAAVEISQANHCSFARGGIIHAGGMGLCLREGTSQIAIEGNEIGDLSGGGIAMGWPNAAAGYMDAAPAPAAGDYSDYRVANNYVHDCGMDYYGAVGILVMPSHHAVVSHNLIHDTAYFGIGLAGSQVPGVAFDGDNSVEYNVIHDAMKTTIDGGAIYITFAQHGGGTRLLGNMIYDTHGNPNHEKFGAHPPSAGIYLDGATKGGIYQDNVLFRNFAAGPLIFDFDHAKTTNSWSGNLFQAEGTPPPALIEALQAYAGPEPAFRKALLHDEGSPCVRYVLQNEKGTLCSAIQYHLSHGDHGVLQIIQTGGGPDTAAFKMRGLDGASQYQLAAYAAAIEPRKVWGGPGVTEEMPMAGNNRRLGLDELGSGDQFLGRDLAVAGLKLKLGTSPRVVWIVYQAKATAP